MNQAFFYRKRARVATFLLFGFIGGIFYKTIQPYKNDTFHELDERKPGLRQPIDELDEGRPRA